MASGEIVFGEWGGSSKDAASGGNGSVLGVEVGRGIDTDPESHDYGRRVPAASVSHDPVNQDSTEQTSGTIALDGTDLHVPTEYPAPAPVAAPGTPQDGEASAGELLDGELAAGSAQVISGDLAPSLATKLRAFAGGLVARLTEEAGQSRTSIPGTAIAPYDSREKPPKSVKPSLFEQKEAALLAELGVKEVNPLDLSEVRGDAGRAASETITLMIDPAIAKGPIARTLAFQAGLAATSYFDSRSVAANKDVRVWGGPDQRPNAAAHARNGKLAALQEASVHGAIADVLGPYSPLASAQRAMEALNKGDETAGGKGGLEVHTFPGDGRMYVDGATLVRVFETQATPEGRMNLRVAKVGNAVRADGSTQEIPLELHVCVQDGQDPGISHELVIAPGLVPAAGGRQDIRPSKDGTLGDWHKGWPEIRTARSLLQSNYLTNLAAAHMPRPGMKVDVDSGEGRLEGSPWVHAYDRKALRVAIDWLSDPSAIGRLTPPQSTIGSGAISTNHKAGIVDAEVVPEA